MKNHIQRLTDEFRDMTYHAIWQRCLVKTYGEIRTLLHPCTIKTSLLKKQVPKSMNVKEIFSKIRPKQKEIARQLNITILPSDREPGFIGQAAMFEVLRNKNADFSYLLDDFHETQIQMWSDGFGLYHLLASLYQIRRHFECPPIDMVRYILEPLNPNTITILWDHNWMHRVMTNAQALQPFMPFNENTYEVLKQLVRIQDTRGLNVSRLAQWARINRKDASFLFNILISCGLIHNYAPVMKNAGLVRKFTVSNSLSDHLVEQEILATSLVDGEDHFLSFEISFPDRVDGLYFDFSGMVCNIENFDLENRMWRIPKHISELPGIEGLHSIFHNSDQMLPINTSKVTERDLFYLALLQSMPMELFPNKISESEIRISKGCDIPLEDVKQGIRNVLRKNLVRNQYSIIIAHDRQFLYLQYEDDPKKTVPLLGKILPLVPITYLHTKASFENGLLAITYPTYLACDVRELLYDTIKETGVNAEVFILKSFKRGDTANILSLIQ